MFFSEALIMPCVALLIKVYSSRAHLVDISPNLVSSPVILYSEGYIPTRARAQALN